MIKKKIVQEKFVFGKKGVRSVFERILKRITNIKKGKFSKKNGILIIGDPDTGKTTFGEAFAKSENAFVPTNTENDFTGFNPDIHKSIWID